MKKFTAAFLLICAIFVSAQEASAPSAKSLYVKANALFLPVGILDAGVEYGLSDKMTLQGEVFISPWKSFAGKYAQFYMTGIEGRYYFDRAFRHWYVGANFSVNRFILQKWNYWSDDPYQYSPESPTYTSSDLYQNGFSFMLGASGGYQFQIAENWNVDIFATVGTVQSYYRGYHKVLGVRYDEDSRPYNKSGEFIPYRGGVMISYKLR